MKISLNSSSNPFKEVYRPGFTLIEMAIVLVIVGIVISIVATVIPTLIQSGKIKKSDAILEKVDYALQGFVVANNRLPCPDTTGDGNADPNDGTDCNSYVGSVPYLTLGFSDGNDAWGNPIRYAVYGASGSTPDLTDSSSDASTFCQNVLIAAANEIAANGGFTSTKVYTTFTDINDTPDLTTNAGQAYVLVSGGQKDLDGANAFFDDLNDTADFQFDAPNKTQSTTYDDLVRSRAVNFLLGRHCPGTGGSSGGGGFENAYPSGCTNGVDDDGDGSVDCSDTDCFGDSACLGGAANVSISTSSVPSGAVNNNYSVTFTASGGITPYQWDLTDNDGFSDFYLHPYTGVLSGTLSQCPGTYTIQVQVTDSTVSTPTTDTDPFDIDVTVDLSIARTSGDGSTDITWSTASQQEAFEANGGYLGTINWLLDTGGATGFTVASTGDDTCAIEKSGSTTPNTYTFTLTGTDSTCATNTASLTLTVTVTASGGGSPGEIVGEIDALEFDTGTGLTPNVIPVSGDIYAIAYTGPGSDGFLKTVQIASNGQITNSAIDTLEFDTNTGLTPNIIPISGDIYAIAYTGPGSDGFLKTVEIASNGQITNSVIDTLEFDISTGLEPNIIPISGDIYAIAYTGRWSDGFLKTVQIASNGQITNSVIDTLEFDTSNGLTPNIISVSGDVYAIAYEGPSSDGFLTTVEIATNGQITNSVIDTLEFDASNGLTPNIMSVSGDIYAIAYAGPGSDGFLKTVEITTAGQITNSVIDTLEFDGSTGLTPNIISVSGDVYAIAYTGPGTDGFLKTVEITTAGQITDPVLDTLEFDTADGNNPNIINISGSVFAIAYSGGGSDGFLKTIELS